MKPATLADYKRRILCALLYIQRHLDEPVELSDLARAACFSPFHFHRVFRGMIGESVSEYVRRLRLERAASRLKTSRAPVIRIALEAGYSSHEAFTRAFQALFGQAPSRFRNLHSPSVAAVRSGLNYSDQAIKGFRALSKGARMKVEVKSMAPLRVAFLRHVGPYNEVAKTWDRLMTVMGKEGFLGGGAMCLGVCHDDPEVTPPGKLRYDACVTVDASFKAEGEIGVQEIAGGEYAVTTHHGPYEKLGQTYAALLGQWLPRSGRELASAPCFEVYLNSPESAAPEDLLTDIYAPLVNAGAHGGRNARREARSLPHP